jgi:hypothetical protein
VKIPIILKSMTYKVNAKMTKIEGGPKGKDGRPGGPPGRKGDDLPRLYVHT